MVYGAVRRILGVGLALPFAGLALVLATVSAGSILERVYFAALPALLAVRLLLGKGRAPGLLSLGATATLGSLLATLLTAHPIGDQPYPWVERVRYAVLVAGMLSVPLVTRLRDAVTAATDLLARAATGGSTPPPDKRPPDEQTVTFDRSAAVARLEEIRQRLRAEAHLDLTWQFQELPDADG